MVESQQSGMNVLDVHECWALLRSAGVGRLAVAGADGPDIFPVNFLVDHGTVVFRTGEGTKLTMVTARPEVAFEVDGYDPDDGQAWSVVVKGQAEQIKGFYQALDAATLPLFPWHAEPKRYFVCVVPVEITGRRFHVVDPETWRNPMTDAHGSATE